MRTQQQQKLIDAAMAEAKQREWPGLDEFHDHEIAYITHWNEGKGRYEARPYPLIGGRIRLFHRDNEDYEGKKGMYVVSRNIDTLKARTKQGKEYDQQVVFVNVQVVGKRGKYEASKSGSTSNPERVETMAFARALRFAGYGQGYTSAEEMMEYSKETAPEDDKEAKTHEKRSAYFAMTNENNIFPKDADRYNWQLKRIGKRSVTEWDEADFDKALDLINWWVETDGESEKVLDAMNKYPNEVFHKSFLELMEVDKLTDIGDLTDWSIAASGAFLIAKYPQIGEHTKPLAKALVKASQVDGLLDMYLQEYALNKFSQMTPEHIENGKEDLRKMIERYNKENQTSINSDLIIEENDAPV